MTPEQQVLWEIREQIGTLDAEDRLKVLNVAVILRNILQGSDYAPPALAALAFALVGAEEAAK